MRPRLPYLIGLGVALVVVAAGLVILDQTSGDEEGTSPVPSRPEAAATGATGWGGAVEPTGPTAAGGYTGETGLTSPATPDHLSGLNLTAYTEDGFRWTDDDLDRIKALSSTAVTLVPTWYLRDASATDIRPEPGKSPSDGSLARAIEGAGEAGLGVILKPHLDVLDGTFRGDIQPADRPAWFRSYRRFIDHYARIASDAGVDLFVVGTELIGVSEDDAEWRSVIESVREEFSGRLTYAANWNEVDRIRFWDALDLIGVDAYYPLSSEGETPTVADLTGAWEPIVDQLDGLSAQWGRPVLITEVGYPAQADGTAHPWEVQPDQGPDEAAQAKAYEAVFRAFAGADWLEGINWWSWRADLAAGEDPRIDYSPEDKEAESVLSAGQSEMMSR